MEDPRPQLQAALKEAMKSKDKERRDVIRMMQSAIKQVEIDTQKDLDAASVIDILQKEAKKRRETITEMEDAGRDEQAESERHELQIIEDFLPRQLSDDEIRAIVKEVIAETGASSPKDMGQVMGPVMQRVKGLADGKRVNPIVKDELS